MDSFTPKIKLSYPEFNDHYKINEALGWRFAYAFENIDGLDWYQSFVDSIFDARDNRKFLPLYRMGDGEYNFLLGKKSYQLNPFIKLPTKQKLLRIRDYFKNQGEHVSGTSTDGLESYTKEEIQNSFLKYIDDLKMVAQHGILALGLDNGNFYGQYAPFVIEAFKKHKIILNPNNYYHVYHVYALFSSSDGARLLRDKNVLILTSLTQEKKDLFNKRLIEDNIARLDFYDISPSKSMIEVIDLKKIKNDIDIILIGAGVGSANILSQLKETNVPCIDIGTILGNYLNPHRKLDRPFMLTDEEFDLDKVKFLNEKQKKTIKAFKKS